MKQQRLVLFSGFVYFFLLIVPPPVAKAAAPPAKEFYRIWVYHFKEVAQEQALDQYLQQALLPAAHRAGIARVGVFKPLANDTAADKKIYVLMPFRSPEQLFGFPGRLLKDAAYLKAAHDYTEAAYNTPPYQRVESIILEAFPKAPVMQIPRLSTPLAEHIYELRSYESATEMLHANKVDMFNAGGETKIFDRLQFNPVFYAGVLSGSRMPNLMYMTSFDNMAARDAHWKSFSSDPEWKTLSAQQGYQHNVSRSEIIFMHAAAYSDF